MDLPARIGRYRIERELGRGGMGVVYAGFDDPLQRRVAIKRIAATDADEAQRRRFLREARAAAQVQHPGVCLVYEISDDGDQPFIAMEYLEGESLAVRLERGPLSVADAVGFTLEMLEALDALHGKSLVHRDVKPSNVFLTPSGVKILDFGLAREVRDSSADSVADTESRVTQAGAIVGTLSYMAPEQLQARPVDPRTDLFALGAVLFEMVAGERAFPGRTQVEIFHQTLHEQPFALSGSDTLRELSRVIRRALAKRPEDRFPSAASMRTALETIRVDESDSDVRTHAVTRVIVLPFRMLRPDDETEFLGFAVPDAVTSALGNLDALVVRSSSAAARFASDEIDFARIASEADVDLAVIGTLVRVGDRLRVPVELVEVPGGAVLWSQQLEVTMRDLFQLQDEIVQHIVESLSLSLTARESRRLAVDAPGTPAAYEYFLRGNQRMEPGFADREGLNVARGLYRRAVEEDPRYAPAWVRMARCAFLLAKGGEEHERNFFDAQTCLERALSLHPDLPEAHHAYALIEIDQGLAREAMARLVRLARESRAEPLFLKALEQACRACGLLEASVASHEKARRLDPQILTSAYVSLWYMGDEDKALAWLPPHPGYADALILGARDREAAIQILKEREESRASPLLHAIVASLRALFEDRREESLAHAERVMGQTAHVELALLASRHVAYFGENRRCVEVLEFVLDNGFNPYRLFVRDDPWLRGLKDAPSYSSLLERARQEYEASIEAFQAAGGEELLAIRAPRSSELE